MQGWAFNEYYATVLAVLQLMFMVFLMAQLFCEKGV